MPLYNFQRRFKAMILSGRKRHTIRAKRKRETKPGETLHLYCGLRTKATELLLRPTCTRVDDIRIPNEHDVLINGEPLDQSEKDSLAYSDGFDDFADMMKFWDGRLPFEGDLIHWNYLNRPQGEARSGKAKAREQRRAIGHAEAMPEARMHKFCEDSKPAVLRQCLLHEGLPREESSKDSHGVSALPQKAVQTGASS